MIFDFDETIIDLEPQHTAAHIALCRQLGSDYAQMPEEFRLGSGRRIIDDVRMMREHFGWTLPEEELFAIRQKAFDEICGRAELHPLPGAVEWIETLRAHHLPMAIASSAVRSSIERILERLGIRDAFQRIVDGSEVDVGKPDPAIYRITAERMGVAPHACLVLEDSTAGVLAAHRAGAFCIAVRNPRAQMRQDLSAADIVVESMDDASRLLRFV